MTDITFITGYFQLPASNLEGDLEKARENVLRICHPMIIYCEPETYPIIKAARERYGYLTHYVIKSFKDMELYKYLEQIKQNRVKNPRADNNNTAEYEIATCSKFTMIRDAIKKDIFGSKYYGWIDFTLANTLEDIKNINKFIKTSAIKNDERVRMCMISYTSKKETEDLQKYYHLHGRCGITGLLITGGAKLLLEFMEYCVNCFESITKAGWGHTDDQIYLQVYFQMVDLGKANSMFNFYFGDYQHVLSNYGEFQCESSKFIILNVLLPNLEKDLVLENSNSKELARQIVKFIMDGYKNNKCNLEKDELIKLFAYLDI